MTVLRRIPDEIRFRPVNVLWLESLASCALCSAVIVDDSEGANRAEHAAWHHDVVETLRVLIDNKADAPQ